MWLPSSTPVRGLLRCLDAGFFIPSFEEEGYHCVGDIRDTDIEEVRGFVAALSMPGDTGERLLTWAFQHEAEEERSSDGTVAEPAVARCSRMMDGAWFEVVSPLYALHMGCENMGPLLYSLVRFVKPSRCLEIGAGYTSAFLLQALEDNAEERARWRAWHGSIAESRGPGTWLVESELDERPSVLHCVDNLAHAGTTAHLLLRVAQRLGLDRHLQLHLDEARAFLAESEASPDAASFDFIWLDGLLDFAPPVRGSGASGVAAGIDAFLERLWPRVAPGGLVLLHSTLTNTAVRGWLDGVQGAAWGPPGAVLSLLEPHKRFQNSVTLLQRRPEGYAEPVHSSLP